MIRQRVARRRSSWAVLVWAVLAGLLAALLFLVVLTDAPAAEREVTHLLAAASIAWDGDLSWDRADYDRHVRIWEREPEAVSLVTGGSKIGFGRPPVYAIVAAPFVRISPTRGPAVLNGLLLASAAVVSALVLQRQVGVWAPAWIAVCVAGTTAFTLLPLASPEPFRLAASAMAWALLMQVGAPRWARSSRRANQAMLAERTAGLLETNGRTVLRFVLAGSLLTLAATAAVGGFVLLPALAAAAWLAWLQPRRLLAAASFAAAAGLTFAAVAGVAAFSRGGAPWQPAQGEVFDRATGFPAVDFEPAERRPAAGPPGVPGAGLGQNAAPARPFGDLDVGAVGVGHAGVGHARPQFDLRFAEGLRLRTLLYALFGHRVGFVPWCVPLVWAACSGFLAGGFRRTLLTAAVACFAVRALSFPFDLGDESSALGPAGIGALLPMFWFLVARLDLGRLLAVAVSAALVVHPLWLRPDTGLQPGPGLLSRVLPEETTARRRLSAPADLFVNGLWLRPLAGKVAPFGGASLVVEDGWVDLLVAWEEGGEGDDRALAAPPEQQPAPIDRLEAVIEQGMNLEVEGAEIVKRRTLPSGQAAIDLQLAAPVVRHRLWWSRETVSVHRLRLKLRDAAIPIPYGDADFRRVRLAHQARAIAVPLGG